MKTIGLKTVVRGCALALLALIATPTPSAAQLLRVGLSTEVIPAFVRGVDGGYDPRTDSYLMVGGAGNVYGVCVGADGQPKAAPFVIYLGRNWIWRLSAGTV
jgi:hypothetical protein